jgi:hypothetical protein
MTKATLIKDSIDLGLAYRFRGSVHYHHGGKHGCVQAGLELEEWRILHFVLKATRRLWITLTRIKHMYETSNSHVHSDTLPLTRPHPLIVPLPTSSIFKLSHLQKK